MRHSLAALKKRLRTFNKIVHGEFEFWEICRKQNIRVFIWRLPKGGKGFYGVNRLTLKNGHFRTYRFVVLDYALFKSGNWLPTAFHELAHHFLHIPSSKLTVYWSRTGEQKRHDKHADVFSLLMRLPLPHFLELAATPVDEIAGFTESELKERKRIYETYGY
jgi:hypothetical protein